MCLVEKMEKWKEKEKITIMSLLLKVEYRKSSGNFFSHCHFPLSFLHDLERKKNGEPSKNSAPYFLFSSLLTLTK